MIFIEVIAQNDQGSGIELLCGRDSMLALLSSSRSRDCPIWPQTSFSVAGGFGHGLWSLSGRCSRHGITRCKLPANPGEVFPDNTPCKRDVFKRLGRLTLDSCPFPRRSEGDLLPALCFEAKATQSTNQLTRLAKPSRVKAFGFTIPQTSIAAKLRDCLASYARCESRWLIELQQRDLSAHSSFLQDFY